MAITYEFNRYSKTPTMTVMIDGKERYLSPFRGYRFQISETITGGGIVHESMTNTKMHELATISCGHAILTRLALDCIERAGAAEIDYDELHKFIEDTIIFLKANAEKIDRHNDIYQAFDSYHYGSRKCRCTDLTGG